MASILLVDDDDDLRELTEDVLAGRGHQMWTSRNGVEALAILGTRLPQLVITDVEMPLLDWPAMVLRMFVLNLGRENIPVIIISGAVEVRNIAASVGTPYFLPKPFQPTALIATVEQALREAIPPRPRS